jgi:hypothetical protein
MHFGGSYSSENEKCFFAGLGIYIKLTFKASFTLTRQQTEKNGNTFNTASNQNHSFTEMQVKIGFQKLKTTSNSTRALSQLAGVNYESNTVNTLITLNNQFLLIIPI